MSDKSVLDGVPVVEKNWSLPEHKPSLGVVGNCPTCGNPIYGPQTIMDGDGVSVRRSCPCPFLNVFSK